MVSDGHSLGLMQQEEWLKELLCLFQPQQGRPMAVAMDMAGGIMLEAVRAGIMSLPAQPTELVGGLSPTESTFALRAGK
jgi:hypothetical protein